MTDTKRAKKVKQWIIKNKNKKKKKKEKKKPVLIK